MKIIQRWLEEEKKEDFWAPANPPAEWIWVDQEQHLDMLKSVAKLWFPTTFGAGTCIPLCLLPSTATPQVKSLFLAQDVLPQEGWSNPGKGHEDDHEEQPNVTCSGECISFSPVAKPPNFEGL